MILPESGLSKQSLLLSESDESRSTVSSLSDIAPPPRYLETRRPNTQITYSFMPQTIPANSMIMSPPSYVDHPHPSYYISVNMNCFTPTSYITTIRRGGWDGDFVGNFEMGISAFRKPNTVCFRDYECPLGEMLEQSSKMFRSVSYLWKSKSSLESTSLELYWEESTFAGSSVLSCFLGKEKMITNVVAKFIPSTFSRRPGRMASDLTRLEVSPQGHDYLDDIVVSVLVIERIRTSPNVLKDIPSSMLKELF